MTETSLKASKGRKSPTDDDDDVLASTSKRPRTAEDFYLFCSFILEYEKYDVLKREEVGDKVDSPLGSTGSAADSIADSLGDSIVNSPTQSLSDNIKTENVSANGVDGNSSSSESHEDVKSDLDSAKATATQDWNWNGMHFSDEDSYDLVTCYCAKPFAGRPMIECSKCLTWIHLSCAKIKKNNIPDVFICIKCKSQKCNNIPPNSSLKAKKRVSV
ncbi:hypothetical protein R5R35_012247 [Gryllus longicercus]|uniref:Zinc finger PHD-type domain-containing protein n=1 Tax=Gryllus longicercus TaxID=2509291 RepID=A0AAN9YZ96_9ORTH